MNITPDMMVSGLAILWSISLPTFPDTLFKLLDNTLGVVLLLVIALMALPHGPIAGVLTLIAVALTFVERNRRKVATKLLNEGVPTLEKQLESAPPMIPTEIHPQYETSHEDEVKFYPEQDQSDNFEPIDTSINEKTAIPTLASNTGSDGPTKFFLNQHLASTELA